MIKLEHIVTASPEQMEFVIEGMRNPMNSWDKSDSEAYISEDPKFKGIKKFYTGDADWALMKKLAKAGTDHRKFMRQMPVYVRITAPLYWWKEFDTYKVGTVSNSCSTMHKIQEKEFTIDDFSHEHLIDYDKFYENEEDVLVLFEIPRKCVGGLQLLCLTVNVLNFYRTKFLETGDKKYWWQMIQLLPSSYNQTRNVSMNYEVLANIYKSRKAHKLDEWREFCKWVETLPYSWLITGNGPHYDGLNHAITVIDEL